LLRRGILGSSGTALCIAPSLRGAGSRFIT
jgi:hypothetical protein